MSASRLDDVDQREDHPDRLDGDEVAVLHRVAHHPPSPSTRRRLDDDHAARQVGEAQGDHLERRADGVRQRVPPDDDALRQSLEPGHLDVLALEHLDHRGSHDPRDVRRDREDERQRRQPHFDMSYQGSAPGGMIETAGKTVKTDVANSATSSRPTTNSGIAASPSETNAVELSKTPSRFSAEYAPSRIDSGIEMMADRKTRNAEFLRPVLEILRDRLVRASARCRGRRAGGRRASPCTAGRADRSSPSRSLSAATLSGVASLPRRARAGSDGSVWVAAKIEDRHEQERERAREDAAENEPEDPAGYPGRVCVRGRR